MSKGFLGVIVIIILVFVGIFTFGGHKSANAPNGKSSGTATNHIEGKGSSGVKLVEYGDYECPYCGQAYPAIKQAVADLNDQITFQFRNFPLVSIHKNAFAGARAAEAAGLQNKYWEMHDELYANQDPSGKTGWVASGDPLNKFFVNYAKQIGLNVDKFKTDYNSDQVNDAINADTAAGNKLNIQGTPAFFLDGKQVDLPYSSGADAVKTVITNAIAQKSKQ